MSDAHCVVVGSGPAGLSAAVALSRLGVDCTLIGPEPPAMMEAEARTAALFPSSIAFLGNLGVWSDCVGHCERLEAIRIVDDSGHLLRAPEVIFAARELGIDDFGYNVPNEVLTTNLARLARHSTRIAWLNSSVCDVQHRNNTLSLVTSDGARIDARLVIAADGRNSVCRTAAGIAARAWNLDQTAIACRFEHARAHNYTSNEFHRPAGPLTTVPMPGKTSSLVWVERQVIAERLLSLDDESFAAALQNSLQGVLGAISNVGPRRSHRLSGHLAERFAQNRVVLIGEAGHGFPPIGAQGLNLSLRDAAVVAELAADFHRAGANLGGPEMMTAYHERRARDARLRTWGVSALNGSLLSSFPLAHLARGTGLHLLAAAPALRRTTMRLGLEGAGRHPRLMQPGGDGLLAA